MDSLVNRWKNTVEAQKSRQRKKSSENHTLSPHRENSLRDSSYENSFNESRQNYSANLQDPTIKSYAQKIIDVLSVKGQEPPSSKNYVVLVFNKVCKEIEDIIRIEKGKSLEESHSEMSRLRDLRESTRIMTDSVNKTVSDLEARLFESEREKILIRKDKEELKTRCEELNKQLQAASLTQETVNILKDSYKTIENTNKTLISNIETIKSSHREKERAWELELSNLQEILEELRDQP